MTINTAMILSAGRGSRMGSLTNNLPKPLLTLYDNITLIDMQIYKLKKAGIERIIINLGYLGHKIIEHLQFKKQQGVEMIYIYEDLGVFDTAGAIYRALPFLSETFLVVNADVYTEFSYHALTQFQFKKSCEAHLLIVDNPAHNLKGDCDLSCDGLLQFNGKNTPYTFTGVGVYHANFFKSVAPNTAVSLGSLFKELTVTGAVTGTYIHDFWSDVGTPRRLKSIQQYLQRNMPITNQGCI